MYVLRLSKPYGESFSIRSPVRIIPAHGKTGAQKYGRSMARRSTQRNGYASQPPDFRTYSPKVTSVFRAISRFIAFSARFGHGTPSVADSPIILDCARRVKRNFPFFINIFIQICGRCHCKTQYLVSAAQKGYNRAGNAARRRGMRASCAHIAYNIIIV